MLGMDMQLQIQGTYCILYFIWYMVDVLDLQT